MNRPHAKHRHSVNTPKKPAFKRTLKIESLERREYLTGAGAVYLAQSLADVVVTATSAEVVTGGSADPAGETLVVDGTKSSGSIVLQPSATLANGVDVLLNGARTSWPRRSPISL